MSFMNWLRSYWTNPTTSSEVPTYILVDCDTCPDAFTSVVELAGRNENIHVHGYSTSKFDTPEHVVRGEDVGNYIGTDYDITSTNPGHKALYRFVDKGRTGMNTGNQINHVIHMLEDVYDNVTCFVLTLDDDVISEVSFTNNMIREVNVHLCNDLDEFRNALLLYSIL